MSLSFLLNNVINMVRVSFFQLHLLVKVKPFLNVLFTDLLVHGWITAAHFMLASISLLSQAFNLSKKPLLTFNACLRA